MMALHMFMVLVSPLLLLLLLLTVLLLLACWPCEAAQLLLLLLPLLLASWLCEAALLIPPLPACWLCEVLLLLYAAKLTHLRSGERNPPKRVLSWHSSLKLIVVSLKSGTREPT